VGEKSDAEFSDELDRISKYKNKLVEQQRKATDDASFDHDIEKMENIFKESSAYGAAGTRKTDSQVLLQKQATHSHVKAYESNKLVTIELHKLKLN